MTLKKRNHKPSAKTAKTRPNTPVEPPAPQTFTHHIRELRRRLFLAVCVSVVVGSVVYYYRDFFVRIVMAPLHGQKLVYLTPTGGFSFIFMVTFYATMLLVLPFVLYQFYAFLRPAIPRHTSRLSLKIGLAATLLMIAGASFGYVVAVPGGLDFLGDFAADYVTPNLTADSYLRFVLGYVVGIGVLFELPLLLLFWHWIKPLTPGGLLNSERFVVVGAFVAAAILSPSPDALSQAIIAVPIIIVYQLGVVAVLLSIRKARRLEKKRTRTIRPPATPIPVLKAKPSQVSPPLVRSPVAVATPKKTSIDGITPAGHRRPVRSPVNAPAVPVPPRPPRTLVVPPRRRVINDFTPIRPQIVDTSR